VGQDWRTLDPLLINARWEGVGYQTKFVVDFKNAGAVPTDNLRIKTVGLKILSREFGPPYCAPRIMPGKTWTMTVWTRGSIAPVTGDEGIRIEGVYDTGRYHVNFNRETCLGGAAKNR